MGRLIDADALTWLVEEYKLAISPITEEQERDNRLPLQMLTEFENIIAEQPTVDAVPVVRCAKCKYHWKNGGDCVAEADFFCADGERRTE
jgi:hypothetical protein